MNKGAGLLTIRSLNPFKLVCVISALALVWGSAQTSIFSFQQFFGYSAVNGIQGEEVNRNALFCSAVFGGTVSTLLLGTAGMFFRLFLSNTSKIYIGLALAFAVWFFLLIVFGNSSMDSQSTGFKFAAMVVNKCCR